MSLDDAIRQARQQADMWDDIHRREEEQERQQRADIAEMGKQAAAALADLGNERFVLVQPAKWYQLGGYRDLDGARYTVAYARACWVISQMAGVRDSDRDPKGPFRTSPLLLLSDGRVGRFWPEPENLRETSMLAEPGEVQYVSTVDLDPIENVRMLMGTGDRTYVDAVKRRLAEAVVAYERKGIRREQ